MYMYHNLKKLRLFFVDGYLFRPLSMTHALYFCGAPVPGPIMWCNTFFLHVYEAKPKRKFSCDRAVNKGQ